MISLSNVLLTIVKNNIVYIIFESIIFEFIYIFNKRKSFLIIFLIIYHQRRGAIVHHLNSFINTGIIIRNKITYRLRWQCLQKRIEDIKEDIDRIFTEVLKIASEIDNKLGNFYR